MPIRCAVIFSLYFMYMSQPAIWGKNRIRVTAGKKKKKKKKKKKDLRLTLTML
jgi:hypothetical protein